MSAQPSTSVVSVIILNWNASRWIPRCLESLRQQTIFSQTEVIFADNASSDDSEKITQSNMTGWTNGYFIQNGGNFGYGGGSNRGAAGARGKYLFFLNPDIWLEPDCLEELVRHAENNQSKIVSPLVMNYDSNEIQTRGEAGFDLFGCLISPRSGERLDHPFTVATFYFIEQEFFKKIGRFDEEFFLYYEEMDLSWRTHIAGAAIEPAYKARMHHATSGSTDKAAQTSEFRRFYANRNQLLTIFKNAHGPLLILALNHIILITVEALAGALLSRNLSFISGSLFKPISDCWRLRRHVLLQRQAIRGFRQRGDWWIIRHFFRFSFGHWTDIKRFLKWKIVIAKPAKK